METNPNGSTENRPEEKQKPKRSQKQIEWSRQLGMRSRELKQRKKELQETVKKQNNETSNNETSNNSVKAIETNPCTNYILFLGGLFIIGGCAVYCRYYFKDSRQNYAASGCGRTKGSSAEHCATPYATLNEDHSTQLKTKEQQVSKKVNYTLSKME